MRRKKDSELTHVQVISPVLDRDRSGDKLEGQDRKPGDGVVPAHCEAPRRVNETDDVREEGTIDRVENSQLSESLASEEQHDSDNQVANDERGGTSSLEGSTRTDEETSTDSTTCLFILLGQPLGDQGASVSYRWQSLSR